MKSNRKRSIKRACIFVPLGILLLFVVVLSALAISNLNLPERSVVVEQLSTIEKSRLSEVFQLRQALGDATWPGWSQADIPLIVYNEKYVFLVGYPNPPAGWAKFPTMQPGGGAWEQVPGDLFEGQAYYRTLITAADNTPQAFTVLVGERWVATFMTREYSQVEFYQGFRQDFPPILSNIIPVRLAWNLLMGKTESHIAALEHESFHAYQGILAQSQLEGAESMYDIEAVYPYDRMESAWYQEMGVLVQAAQAKTDTDARDLARQFLQLRNSRRAGLNASQVKLEQEREWEEGLAKYAELEITRQAGSTPGYVPVEGLSQDTAFHDYQSQSSLWAEQLKEAANRNLSGDTRFYYSGNALAVLLDRLLPGWKARALPGGEFLDVLLQEALK